MALVGDRDRQLRSLIGQKRLFRQSADVPAYRTSKGATHPLAYAPGPSSRPISTALRPWWTPLWVAAARNPLRLMANM